MTASDTSSSGAIREGPFWDVMAGRAAPPPAAVTLGFQLVDVDPDAGTITTSFRATDAFPNPFGMIQGGFLAAMLDDTMGPAMFIHAEGRLFTPTIDMHVSFLEPARPGPIVGEGQVIRAGGSIAFLEGRLSDAKGSLLARATASARLVAAEKALA